MNRRREQPALRMGMRSTRKPATICGEPSWQQLLRSGAEETGTAAGGRAGFSTDETEGILFVLAQAVEQRDRQTAGHCQRLALISVALGVALELQWASLLALYRGG